VLTGLMLATSQVLLEEDNSNVDLPYIPAENSPTRQQFNSKSADSDSDDDPLEAFMDEVEARPSS